MSFSCDRRSNLNPALFDDTPALFPPNAVFSQTIGLLKVLDRVLGINTENAIDASGVAAREL